MFSQGGRDQFWYEGAVVALLYVGMSSAILGVYAGIGWKRCFLPFFFASLASRSMIQVYRSSIVVVFFRRGGEDSHFIPRLLFPEMP